MSDTHALEKQLDEHAAMLLVTISSVEGKPGIDQSITELAKRMIRNSVMLTKFANQKTEGK